jgi:SAM-dependent methyltransferase
MREVAALNATVHHCDDMQAVIAESGRLVKPGGVIIIDHDPQLSAWNYRGVGKLLWEMRKPLYRLMKRGGHSAEDNEQEWAEATEIHTGPATAWPESFCAPPSTPCTSRSSSIPTSRPWAARSLTDTWERSR